MTGTNMTTSAAARFNAAAIYRRRPAQLNWLAAGGCGFVPQEISLSPGARARAWLASDLREASLSADGGSGNMDRRDGKSLMLRA
jgi:hypothetical protein